MEFSVQLSQTFYDSLIKYRNAIFGVAIIYIIVYHMGIVPLFGRGFIGVDIFLFLSSFGLCFSLGKHSLAEFYIRRLNRVYPLFVFSNILKWTIGRFLGERLNAWDSFCDISGLTFFGFGGKHMLWFIPSLMILYIITPPLYKIVKRFGQYALYVIIVISFIVMFLCPSMDWHYSCLVSRLPVFVLGILYFVYNGDLKKLFAPLLAFILFHELSINNDLKYLVADFYSPMLLLALCALFSITSPRRLSHLSWIGSKSLECFIGNGMITQFLIFEGVSRLVYYIIGNIFWIALFIGINKLLPANK